MSGSSTNGRVVPQGREDAILLRRVVAAGALTVLGGAAAALYATQYEPYRPVFRYRRVAVPPTWPALDILHLSDLHVRRGDMRLLRAQKRALADLRAQPDIVCVTGDLCEQLGDAHLVAELLDGVRPRLGTYVILGNHEYAAPPPAKLRRNRERPLWLIAKTVFPRVRSTGPEEAEAIVEVLCGAGLNVLRNEGVRLVTGGRGLWLAGADSTWAGRANIHAALQGKDPGEGALALIHEPELAFAAVEHGADLVLAGHTHGGQVSLPLIGAPYTHRVDERVRIAAGFQRIGPSLLHITTGMGQLMPLRFSCPPELVWLRCEPSATPHPTDNGAG